LVTTEFDITAEKIDIIVASCNALGIAVTRDHVKFLYDQFEMLAETVKEQYLAHIVRAMEIHFRKKTGNPYFIIKYEPYSHNENKTQCAAALYPGRRFVIHYLPDLPEKELRVHLAHELGHLFLLALNEHAQKDKRLNFYSGTTEPLSSILGIFIISHKNGFYANAFESGRNHKDWNSVLQDFLVFIKEKNI